MSPSILPWRYSTSKPCSPTRRCHSMVELKDFYLVGSNQCLTTNAPRSRRQAVCDKKYSSLSQPTQELSLRRIFSTRYFPVHYEDILQSSRMTFW
jgi:hypothetical protein